MNANETQVFTEADIISTYTRAEAIEDGVLIDVTETAKEAGIKVPTAVTAAVWSEVITPDETRRSQGQSEEGRLWDVLNILRYTAQRSKESTLTFYVLVKDQRLHKAHLKSTIAGGDDGEPVITIMLPNED